MMVTSSTSPISLSSRRFLRAPKFGSNRRLKPIISGTPAFSTTGRQASMRSTDSDTGFSQRIGFPACAAASMRSAWVSIGVQMRMASTSLAPITASTAATLAPTLEASASAASGSASAT